MPKEYIIYSDESVLRGRYFSNFYGGALIASDRIDLLRERISEAKRKLNLNNEVKWQRVTEPYLNKYIELMDIFFDSVEAGDIKVRIMFSQNMYAAKNLTQEQIKQGYFILYYQFIKHAFGFLHHPVGQEQTRIRLLLDQLPDTQKKPKDSGATFAAFHAILSSVLPSCSSKGRTSAKFLPTSTPFCNAWI